MQVGSEGGRARVCWRGPGRAVAHAAVSLRIVSICGAISGTTLTVPGDVTSIEEGFLNDCNAAVVKAITKVVVPPSVVSIGQCSFTSFYQSHCPSCYCYKATGTGPSNLVTVEFQANSQLTSVSVDHCTITRSLSSCKYLYQAHQPQF